MYGKILSYVWLILKEDRWTQQRQGRMQNKYWGEGKTNIKIENGTNGIRGLRKQDKKISGIKD